MFCFLLQNFTAVTFVFVILDLKVSMQFSTSLPHKDLFFVICCFPFHMVYYLLFLCIEVSVWPCYFLGANSCFRQKHETVSVWHKIFDGVLFLKNAENSF